MRLQILTGSARDFFFIYWLEKQNTEVGPYRENVDSLRKITGSAEKEILVGNYEYWKRFVPVKKVWLAYESWLNPLEKI